MTRWRLTARMGEGRHKVTIGPGPTIGGSDAVQLNIDATTMTRRELASTLKVLGDAALEAAFPPAGAAPDNSLTFLGEAVTIPPGFTGAIGVITVPEGFPL